MLSVKQVMGEGLMSKRVVTEHQKQAVQNLESYFGVNGLLAKAAAITYRRKNVRVRAAVEAAAGVPSAGRHTVLTAHMYLTRKLHEGLPVVHVQAAYCFH